jgi:outer membrane immunogenic protein
LSWDVSQRRYPGAFLPENQLVHFINSSAKGVAMRRILRAAAAAGLTLSMGVIAQAADMRRAVVKAPPPAPPAYGWTGCYVGVGAGYGLSNEELALVTVQPLPGIPVNTTFVDGLTLGGRGWLATAQLGCDYQFAGPFGGNWVLGAFVDADWTNIKGRHTGGNQNIGLQQGEEKLRWGWAVGGRLGWLVGPPLLTYVSGGYTEATFSEVNYALAIFPTIGTATGLQLPERTYQGWFVGGGVEYALGWLPGLFWKTEYRFADYRARTDTVLCTTAACGAVGSTAFAERVHPYVQTVRSELVWRFNWGNGPVAARY